MRRGIKKPMHASPQMQAPRTAWATCIRCHWKTFTPYFNMFWSVNQSAGERAASTSECSSEVSQSSSSARPRVFNENSNVVLHDGVLHVGVLPDGSYGSVSLELCVLRWKILI